jgi:hypothetical protein
VPRFLLPWLLAAVAAGGYWQVAGQDTFYCGRTEAGWGLYILVPLTLAQTALYLAATAQPSWQRLYRWSQMSVLPVLVFSLAQVVEPHLWTFCLMAALAGVTAWMGLARGGLFLILLFGLFAALGQIPFSLPGVTVPTWLVWALFAAAAGIAAWWSRSPALPPLSPPGPIWRIVPVPSWPGVAPTPQARPPPHPRRRGGGRDPPGHDDGVVPFRALVPLSLLLFPILRAHWPDVAYDSLSYKVTIPYQMAEWRTGGTAIVDGYMIGTNLQEMLNTLLLILTGDWMPSFISTLGFVLLALAIPRAFPAETGRTGPERAVIAFAGVSAFVLTEAGIAQGTAYQEPLLLLFLVASLIRHPAWIGFLAMAMAVKITALFAAPLILLYQALSNRGFWRSPRQVIAGVLVATLALAPQLGRNVIVSGRLLGMNETLAQVTDPPGPHQILASGDMIYDHHPRGGLLNNAASAACNIWLLGGACPVLYQGSWEAGFGHFPSSRAPLFALVVGIATCIGWRRREAWLGLGAFLIGAAGLLCVLSEGRYLLPVSLGFAILLLINRRSVASMACHPAMLLLACWMVGAELVPGTFTNTSWICQRDVTAPVLNPPLRGPETPVQAFLASLADRYKKTCPPPGLPPVILAENDRLNSPYLGTQRIFHVFSQILIDRFLQADPSRQARMADAVLAVVSEHPGYAPHVLGSSQADFRPCYDGDGLHVLCSVKLAPAGPDCSRSLY